MSITSRFSIFRMGLGDGGRARKVSTPSLFSSVITVKHVQDGPGRGGGGFKESVHTFSMFMNFNKVRY